QGARFALMTILSRGTLLPSTRSAAIAALLVAFPGCGGAARAPQESSPASAPARPPPPAATPAGPPPPPPTPPPPPGRPPRSPPPPGGHRPAPPAFQGRLRRDGQAPPHPRAHRPEPDPVLRRQGPGDRAHVRDDQGLREGDQRQAGKQGRDGARGPDPRGA